MLHAGIGHSADVIDLPTAGGKVNGIFFFSGSSIKGVVSYARLAGNREKKEAVFGPFEDPAAHAKVVVVGDARLLALTVRSFQGTPPWIASPLWPALAKCDLDETNLPIPVIPGPCAQLAWGSFCVHQNQLYLEDLDLLATESNEATVWAERLELLASPADDTSTQRFAVVDGDVTTFLLEKAT